MDHKQSSKSTCTTMRTHPTHDQPFTLDSYSLSQVNANLKRYIFKNTHVTNIKKQNSTIKLDKTHFFKKIDFISSL